MHYLPPLSHNPNSVPLYNGTLPVKHITMRDTVKIANANANFLAKHHAVEKRNADVEERTRNLMFALLRKEPVRAGNPPLSPSSSSSPALASSPSTPTQPRRRRRSSSSAPSVAGKSTETSAKGLKQWLRKSLKGSSRRRKAKADQKQQASNPDAGGGPRVGDDNGVEIGGGPSGLHGEDSFYYFASAQDSPRAKARASKARWIMSTIQADDATGIARGNVLSSPASSEVDKVRQTLMTSKGPNWMVL